jgi:hypothetical protein
MNWFKLIKLASESNYGYWLDPTGKEYPVGYQQHEQVASDLGFDGYMDAWAAGWVRVVAYSSSRGATPSCGCSNRKGITPAQRDALMKIFKDNFCEDAYIELGGKKDSDFYAPRVRTPIKAAYAKLSQFTTEPPTDDPRLPPPKKPYQMNEQAVQEMLDTYDRKPKPSTPITPPAPVSPPPPAPAPATIPPRSNLTRQQLMDQARQKARGKVNPLKR